ncbi:ABC transporter permease [Demequina zhanjiangensis]|uniref:ABC transporter permease n=1 Tax=Demequina zhanjiangensis TaxID=3051659 RepID=A0ABT8G2H4_9MICO|nr:ABC transporter permease [Demequina sp. SYSU T00b26]MDN4473212.1 ABC transporter permease [Demequina sp. SYSU T00b26]
MSPTSATLTPSSRPRPRPRTATRSSSPRRSRDLWLGVLGVLIVLAGAELLSRTGIVNPDFLPPVTEMYAALFAMLGEGWFWEALWLTVRGWAVGLAAAMALGVVVGYIIGSSTFLRRFTSSTVEFLRPIPSVALIPLVILIFGTQPQSAFVLVVYAAFWQVLVQVLYGVADVDPVARDTARSYRFGPIRIARSVVYPTALPYIMTAFRLGAAVALILEITAELVIGVDGLGRELGIAQSSGAVPETYALVIVIGFIGVAVNLLVRLLERKALWWHPSVRSEQS